MYLIHKKTMLAGAVLMALAAPSAHAQSTGVSQELKELKSTVEELRKQLQALKKGSQPVSDQSRVQELGRQVDELREQLKRSQSGAVVAATPAPATQEENQESIEARTPASKADIQGLRTDIENYKYDQARLQERNIPSVTRNTKIGGSLTLRHDIQTPGAAASSSSSGFGPTDRRSSGFNAAAFGFNFAGNLYRDYAEGRNLTYRLALTSDNSATTGKTGVNLTDAYIRYSFQPSTGNPEDPLGTVTLGQQVVPFGQDAQALDPEVKAVIGSAGFVAGLGLGTRQTGVVLSGDYDPYVDFTNNYRAPLLAYSLGVFNGNGSNKADNNNHRDWVARLVYTLPVDYSSWFRQLQLGVSYYRGSLSLGPSSTTATTTSTETGTNDIYGFDVNWTHLPFSVSYERAAGKQQLYKLDALVTSKKNADGFKRGVGQYINFGYTWGEQFLNSSKQQGKFDDYWPKSYQAFIRFDTWDPNTSDLVKDDRKQATTLGLNVFFAETTKFQVNYVRTRNQLGSAAPTKDNPKTSDLWQLQLNATF